MDTKGKFFIGLMGIVICGGVCMHTNEAAAWSFPWSKSSSTASTSTSSANEAPKQQYLTPSQAAEDGYLTNDGWNDQSQSNSNAAGSRSGAKAGDGSSRRGGASGAQRNAKAGSNLSRNAQNTDSSVLSILERDIYQQEKKPLTQYFDKHWKGSYVRLDWSWIKNTNKPTGFTNYPRISQLFGVGLGVELGPYPMRLEIVRQTNTFKITQGTNALSANAITYLVNLYNDFPLSEFESLMRVAPWSERFTPYLMAGAGRTKYSNVKKSGVNASVGGFEPSAAYSIPLTVRSTTAAWNVGAGLKTRLNRKFFVDLGYRYTKAGDIPVSTTQTSKVTGHQAIISLIMAL